MQPYEVPMNRLQAEVSPYLRSHALNPVAWRAYGDEVFEEARRTGKPILLSIGYSTCHWCHVMAHESFSDEETARLLNSRFIPVKVDREERPDVDEAAMRAALALCGHGGWPLHVFLTPEGLPFHAGTYFPPEPRMGMPSFRQVLLGVSEWLRQRPEEVTMQARRLDEHLKKLSLPAMDGEPFSALAARDEALRRLRAMADSENGGWGRAPKFPQPSRILLFLRSSDAEDRAHALRTLDAIRCGGITDQVAGGVSRYSVDARWGVPHFEKMLYDNAQLLELYAHAAAMAQKEGQRVLSDEFRSMAYGIYEYLERDLKLSSGLYAAAEDADSEGEEGRFYVFTLGEFQAAVSEDFSERELEFLEACFGVTEEGNFEGTNVLSLAVDAGDLAARTGVAGREVGPLLAAARRALMQYREKRVRPHRDDKALLAWNSLAASALLRAGELLSDTELSARGLALCRTLCVDFLGIPFERFRGQAQRLEAVSHFRMSSSMHGEAFADDVAALMEAVSLAIVHDAAYLNVCLALAQWFLEGFVDGSGTIFLRRERQGFGAEATREEDGVVPSPASLAFVAAEICQAHVLTVGALSSSAQETLMRLRGVAEQNCMQVASRIPEAQCRFLAELSGPRCTGGVCQL